MRYVFICDNCELAIEFIRSLKDGPPKEGSDDRKCPECSEEMYHDFNCNFILKGDFPGKMITRDNEGTTTAEKAEKLFHEDAVKKKEGDEVMAERRKGTASFKEYEKHNKIKVKNYWKNRREGTIKPK